MLVSWIIRHFFPNNIDMEEGGMKMLLFSMWLNNFVRHAIVAFLKLPRGNFGSVVDRQFRLLLMIIKIQKLIILQTNLFINHVKPLNLCGQTPPFYTVG